MISPILFFFFLPFLNASWFLLALNGHIPSGPWQMVLGWGASCDPQDSVLVAVRALSLCTGLSHGEYGGLGFGMFLFCLKFCF